MMHGVGCRDRLDELVRHHLRGQVHVQSPLHCDPIDARSPGAASSRALENLQLVVKISHLRSVLELLVDPGGNLGGLGPTGTVI